MSVITASRRRQKPRTSWFSMLLVIGILYFSYHTFSGNSGLFAFISLTQEAQATQAELETIRAERLSLEHRVNLMRSESLDLDLLDEQARKRIGYAHKKETVYLIQDNKILGIDK